MNRDAAAPHPSAEPVPTGGLKASFDKAAALAALILLSPLMLLIALLIKLEGLFDPEGRGPVFFHQVRISEGRPFPFRKFRVNRKSVLDEEPVVRRRDRMKTLERDEYCTRVGRVLRDLYLDELPQLFNILLGEMSLVGPRPWPQDDYEDDLRAGRTRKKVIRAGLTGLVQIHKGHDVGKSDVEFDEEYIAECRRRGQLGRLLYDLSIMARTVRILLERKGL